MQCINFDEKFEEYVTQWMENHAADFGHNMDRMEAQMPVVYQQWCETPAEWLSGISPAEYFLQYDNVSELVVWMLTYFRDDVPVPDQLLERITMLGEDAEQCLLAILQDDIFVQGVKETQVVQNAKIMAISLLAEMDSVKPMDLYIRMIANSSEGEECVDHAAQALTAMGPSVVAPILKYVNTATRAGREAFLDILCNFPGDDAIYKLAIAVFQEEVHKRALYASLLGKLGDERALTVLESAIHTPNLAYLDYIEIRNAIEMLGGEAPERSDFAGDVGYESLRRMK